MSKRINLHIKGVIGVDTTAEGVKDVLNEAGNLSGKVINLVIDSAGGFISAGDRIRMELQKAKNQGAQLVAHVHNAYSMAAVLATEASELWLGRGSTLMFHGAHLAVGGVNQKTAANLVNFLDKQNTRLANTLARNTRRSFDEWVRDLKDGSDIWVNYEDAGKFGLNSFVKEDSELEPPVFADAVKKPTTNQLMAWSFFDGMDELSNTAKALNLSIDDDMHQLILSTLNESNKVEDVVKFDPEFSKVLNTAVIDEVTQAVQAKAKSEEDDEDKPSEEKKDEASEPAEEKEDEEQDKKQPTSKSDKPQDDKKPAEKAAETDEEEDEEDDKKSNPFKKASKNAAESDLGAKSTDCTTEGENAQKSTPAVDLERVSDQDVGATNPINKGNEKNTAPTLDLVKVKAVFSGVENWSENDRLKALALKCQVLEGVLSLEEAGKQLVKIQHPDPIIENNHKDKNRNMTYFDNLLADAPAPTVAAAFVKAAVDLGGFPKEAGKKALESVQPYLATENSLDYSSEQSARSFLESLNQLDGDWLKQMQNAGSEDKQTLWSETLKATITVLTAALPEYLPDDPTSEFTTITSDLGGARGGLQTVAQEVIVRVPQLDKPDIIVEGSRPGNISSNYGKYLYRGLMSARSLVVFGADLGNKFNVQRFAQDLVALARTMTFARLVLFQTELVTAVQGLTANQKLEFTGDAKFDQQDLADPLLAYENTRHKLTVKALDGITNHEFEQEVDFKVCYADRSLKVILEAMFQPQYLNGQEAFNTPNPLKALDNVKFYYFSASEVPALAGKAVFIDPQVFGDFVRGVGSAYDTFAEKNPVTNYTTYTVKRVEGFFTKHKEGLFLLDLAGLTKKTVGAVKKLPTVQTKAAA